MELLLDWAEGFQKHMVTPKDGVALVNWSDSAMMNYDVNRLDRELWSLLNLNLPGKVTKTFDTLPRLHGLEAWRRVVYPMGPRTLHRQLSMYTDIHNPPRCAELADVEEAVEKWEEQLRDYKRCGGRICQSTRTNGSS
jgi:hypothetical protein